MPFGPAPTSRLRLSLIAALFTASSPAYRGTPRLAGREYSIFYSSLFGEIICKFQSLAARPRPAINERRSLEIRARLCRAASGAKARVHRLAICVDLRRFAVFPGRAAADSTMERKSCTKVATSRLHRQRAPGKNKNHTSHTKTEINPAHDSQGISSHNQASDP